MILILLFLLTFGVNCYADDQINAIDDNTFAVTTTTTVIKSIADTKKEISDIQEHKAKVQQEEENLAAIVVDDEEKIENLKAQINKAENPTKDLPVDNSNWTDNQQVNNNDVNWQSNP